jgi:transcriptional regulator with XRE-family HTH domain
MTSFLKDYTDYGEAPAPPAALTPEQKLKLFLNKKGISQAHIARNLNPQVSRQWVNRILQGKDRLPEFRRKQIEELLEIEL